MYVQLRKHVYLANHALQVCVLFTTQSYVEE